jgi:hypothetical protein
MSVMIALPCGGGFVSDKTTNSLFNLGKILVRNNIDHGLLTSANSSLITQGRSRMANFFINNTEFDYLFFLDNDIGFDPEDVLKLLRYNMDIVSGAYPLKSAKLTYCVNVSQPRKKINNLLKIDGNGLGFTLIQRNVFVEMAKRYPDLKYTPVNNMIPNEVAKLTEKEINNSYHFFQEEKIGDRYLSEDKSFFYRANAIGFESWLDVTIKLTHVGSHVFGDEL